MTGPVQTFVTAVQAAAAGAWLSERRLVRPVLVVSVGLLAFWTFQFATWAWVA